MCVGEMVWWCTRLLVCVFFLSFSLSNSFFCALWCSIQVIVHVYTCIIYIYNCPSVNLGWPLCNEWCMYMYIYNKLYYYVVWGILNRFWIFIWSTKLMWTQSKLLSKIELEKNSKKHEILPTTQLWLRNNNQRHNICMTIRTRRPLYFSGKVLWVG